MAQPTRHREKAGNSTLRRAKNGLSLKPSILFVWMKSQVTPAVAASAPQPNCCTSVTRKAVGLLQAFDYGGTSRGCSAKRRLVRRDTSDCMMSFSHITQRVVGRKQLASSDILDVPAERVIAQSRFVLCLITLLVTHLQPVQPANTQARPRSY